MRIPPRTKLAAGTIGSAMLSMLLLSGCSICSPGFIDDYATVGGKWSRADPENGRVGSIFSDPGSGMDGQYVDSIYEGEVYEDEYYEGEVYDGDVYEGGNDAIILDAYDEYSEGGTIEVVPQYEEGSIILGDEW